MITRIVEKPAVLTAAGNPPKEIQEFIGRVNTGTTEVSIARMISPAGWSEPGQTPLFNEYSVVLNGSLHVKLQDRTIVVNAGQAVMVQAGEWVQYHSPEGAEYIATCVPGFSPKMVNRDVDFPGIVR